MVDFLASGPIADGPINLASDLTEIVGANKTAVAYLITGKVHLPNEGVQTFRVKINGGGWMYLGDELVFSKVGPNEITEEFSVTLPAGIHDLKIITSRRISQYFN